MNQHLSFKPKPVTSRPSRGPLLYYIINRSVTEVFFEILSYMNSSVAHFYAVAPIVWLPFKFFFSPYIDQSFYQLSCHEA